MVCNSTIRARVRMCSANRAMFNRIWYRYRNFMCMQGVATLDWTRLFCTSENFSLKFFENQIDLQVAVFRIDSSRCLWPKFYTWHEQQFYVNGIFQTTPYYYPSVNGWKVKAYATGDNTYIETDFHLLIQHQWCATYLTMPVTDDTLGSRNSAVSPVTSMTIVWTIF